MKLDYKKILNYLLHPLILAIGFFAIPLIASAQAQPLMNFAGKVTNVDGTELADGPYDFLFRLHDARTGGAPLWSEDLTAANLFSATVDGATVGSSTVTFAYSGAANETTLHLGQYLVNADTGAAALIVDYDTIGGTVTVAGTSHAWTAGAGINNRPFVEGGVIDIKLGAVNPLAGLDMSQDLYLEVVFNGETMSPRRYLPTVKQAYDALSIGGKTIGQLAALDENETVTGQWSFNSVLSVATTSSQTALTVTQDGAGNVVEFRQGANTRLAVLADGRVQIGNYRFPLAYGSPGYTLKTDASGNLYWDDDRVGGFGSSGGDMLWATNTLETLIHPIDTAMEVVVGNIATSTFGGNIFEVHGSSLFDLVNISNAQQLRFYDLDSSNYIALRATNTLSTNLVLTLPNSYGAPNTALITDGAGNLTWGSPSTYVYVNPGAAGQLAYYAANGSQLSPTSTIQVFAGGTGASTAAGARANLGLDGVYGNRAYMIDTAGAWGQVWLSDGLDQGFWAATSSLRFALSQTSGILPAGQGGTGQDTSGWTGFPYVAGGTWSASNTIDAARLSPLVMLAGENVSLLANDADYITLADLSAVSPLSYASGTGAFSLGLVPVSLGGLGTTTFQSGSLVYAQAANTIGEVMIGPEGNILQVVSGAPAWVSTTSLGIDFNAIGGMLAADQGGTGQDSSGWTGFTYVSGGIWSASSTIGADRLSPLVMLAGENVSLLNNDADYITLSALSGTAPIDYNDLTGAISLDTVPVSLGGTGSTTLATGGLLYGDGTNPVKAVSMGTAGYLLRVNLAGNGYDWIDAGSVGVDTWRTDQEIRDVAGALVASSSGSHARISIAYNAATQNMDFIVEDDLSLYDNAVSRFYSTTTGALPVAWGGTGTTTVPGVRSVLGLDTAYANQGYMISSAGTWGQVWTSDGAGQGTWTATSGLRIALSDTTGTLGVARGGLGTTTFQAYSLLYARAADTIGEVLPGQNGLVLKMVSGRPQWEPDLTDSGDSGLFATTTNGLMLYPLAGRGLVVGATATSAGGFVFEVNGSSMFDDVTAASLALSTALAPASGGTGLSSGPAYGQVMVGNGAGGYSLFATSTLGLLKPADIGSLVQAHSANLSGLAALSPAAGNFIVGGGAAWGATTTAGARSALDLVSIYNNRAYMIDAPGSWGQVWMSDGAGAGGWAATSAIKLALSDTTGTLGVDRGGTGLTGIASQSLVYASSDDVLAALAAGGEGEVLSVVGGQLAWSSTAAPVAHNLLSAYHPDTLATSTIIRGDLIVAGASARWTRLGLGAAGYILYSDGTDAAWASTTAITALGTITTGVWQGGVIDIAYGGTGADTAEGARANLGLADVHKFAITSTGTAGWLWQSDGDGAGRWVATGSLGFATGGYTGKFVGLTAFTSDGSIATSGLVGYQAANHQCAFEYAGGHMCRTHEILQSIEQDDISGWGNDTMNGWIAEGPPGYTWDSNDCNGWRDNGGTQLGAFWLFNATGGGAGWLVNCTIVKPVACCAWE